jgi:hypothetical protein
MNNSNKDQKYELPAFPDAAMIDLLTQIIFIVTAYHALICTAVDYTILPDRAGFQISSDCNDTQIDLPGFLLQQASIAAATSLCMPKLMSKFKNFFGAGGAPAWERDVWDMFVVNLGREQSKIV